MQGWLGAMRSRTEAADLQHGSRFDQNLPQGEKSPTEHRIQPKIEDKGKSEEEEVRSEVFNSCGAVTVTYKVLSSVVVKKRYIYSNIVLQLIVVPPTEYPINRFIFPEPINYLSRYQNTRNSIASSTK
jgi:hypothetical protein